MHPRTLILAAVLSAPSVGLCTLVVTSIENRATDGSGVYRNDYKITWARVPGPSDSDKIPAGITSFGAMEEHDHVAFACNNVGAGLFPGVKGTTCVPVNSSMTWAQAEQLWINTYGASGPGVVGHLSNTPGSRECVMFAGQPTNYAGVGQQINNGELVCVGAPPSPDPLCALAGDSVLEFLTTPSAISDQASTHNQIVCDLPANVVLTSGTGMSSIAFPWGQADITVNGAPLPARLHPDPVADIEIGAAITGAGAAPGEYTGSLILVVGYE